MAYGDKPDASPPYGARRAAALVLVIASGWLVTFGVRSYLGSGDHAAAPEPGQSTVAETGRTVRPVQLRIPAIKVSADVTGLGLNDDRTVAVPKDPDDVGWYRLGPAPGRPGSAVILGHVDSVHGPAVFYRLRDLKRGDRVDVRLADATVAHFKVARVASYANEDFPAIKVYRGGAGGRPTLNLVTCTGAYDKSAGGYQSNLVVYTTYLWATKPAGRDQHG